MTKKTKLGILYWKNGANKPYKLKEDLLVSVYYFLPQPKRFFKAKKAY